MQVERSILIYLLELWTENKRLITNAWYRFFLALPDQILWDNLCFGDLHWFQTDSINDSSTRESALLYLRRWYWLWCCWYNSSCRCCLHLLRSSCCHYRQRGSCYGALSERLSVYSTLISKNTAFMLIDLYSPQLPCLIEISSKEIVADPEADIFCASKYI